MITVAGFNTAIDRRVVLQEGLVAGAVQRAQSGQALPGGKGLHVAQMAVELGQPTRLVGLTDAAHDALIAAHLRRRGVQWHGVDTGGALRQCLALHEPDGRITEVLEPGPTLGLPQRQALIDTLRTLKGDSRVLVLSGSLPQGFPATTYAALVDEANRADVPCLVDASGALLRHAVDAGPYLVKPNAEEAAVLWGRPVRHVDEALAFAGWLHARGVHRVVVTLGADGAVGFDGAQAWHAAVSIEGVVNSVGSGDCFMASLAVSAGQGDSMDVALTRAVACGAANARNEETGHAPTEQVQALQARVRLRKLDGGA